MPRPYTPRSTTIGSYVTRRNDPRHPVCLPHAHRQVPGRAGAAARAAARRPRDPRGGAPGGDRSRRRGRSDHGQCAAGRRRPGAGAPGGDPRRSARHHSGAHRQQGVRLGSQGGDARGSGDQGRRRTVRRRRRDGVDVQRAALRLRDARGHQGGKQPARGRHDPRRLVGLVFEHAHGEPRGVQREKGGCVPPGPGRVRARESPESRGRDDGVPLQGRDRGSRDPREKGSRRDREG